MLMGSVLFLTGQERCASLLGNCLLGVLQQRLEDTGEIWKSDLKQRSCVRDETHLGRQCGDIC